MRVAHKGVWALPSSLSLSQLLLVITTSLLFIAFSLNTVAHGAELSPAFNEVASRIRSRSHKPESTGVDTAAENEERCGLFKKSFNSATGEFESCMDENPELCICSRRMCCSRWGYCGTTEAECSPKWGCQEKFGRCSPPELNLNEEPPDVLGDGKKVIGPPCLFCEQLVTLEPAQKAPEPPKPPPELPPVSPPPKPQIFGSAFDEGPPQSCASDLGPKSCPNNNDSGSSGSSSDQPSASAPCVGCSPLPDPNKEPLTAAVEAAGEDPFLRRPQVVKLRAFPYSPPPGIGLPSTSPASNYRFVPSHSDQLTKADLRKGKGLFP